MRTEATSCALAAGACADATENGSMAMSARPRASRSRAATEHIMATSGRAAESVCPPGRFTPLVQHHRLRDRPQRFRDAFDCNTVCRFSQAHVEIRRPCGNHDVRQAHLLAESGVDFVARPALTAQVLYPLEVAHNHTTG